MLIVGALAYFYPVIFEQVNSRLAKQLEAELNKHANPIGIHCTVGNAKFEDGVGISLKDVIIQSVQKQSLAKIDFAKIRSTSQLADLIAGSFKPSAIEIDGAQLDVVRTSDGNWNFSQIIELLQQQPKQNQKPLPIHLRDCALSYSDESSPRANKTILATVDLDLFPNAPRNNNLEFIGQLISTNGGFLQFRTGQIVNQHLPIEFEMTDLQVNRALIDLFPSKKIPPGLKAAIGLVDGTGRLNLDLNTNQPKLFVDGKIKRFSVDHDKLPFLVTDTEGPFKIENNVFRTQISGIAGTSKNIKGRFDINVSHRFGPTPNWSVEGVVRNLQLEQKLAQPFDRPVKKFFENFQPTGQVNVGFSLGHDGQKLTRKANANIANASFRFVEFPYPVNNATGTVELINDQLWFDVTAKEQTQTLRFKGEVQGKGIAARMKTDFWSEGTIPIDERMLRAINVNPKIAQTIFDFRPVGHIQVIGQTRKVPGEEKVRLDYDVELANCQTKHVSFEYPVFGLEGLLEVRGGNVTIKNVRGNNRTNKSRVICNGTWNRAKGLDLSFDVYDAEMDNELRAALAPNIQMAWDAIHPSGNAFYTKVALTSPPGQEHPDVIVDALLADPDDPNRSTAAIQPEHFPYRLGQMAGRVRIGDGKVQLAEIRGKHGRALLSCNGEGDYSPKGWRLALTELRAGSVTATETLLDAVPTSLRKSLEGLAYEGNASCHGNLNLYGEFVPNKIVEGIVATASYESNASEYTSTFGMDWNVRMDMNGAKMNVGMPIENVFGSVTLLGEYDGNKVVCSGTIDVESLHFLGLQVTDVVGPLWIDNQIVGIGSLAKPNGEELTDNTLTAKVFGGTLRLDGQSWEDAGPRFYLQTAITNFDVTEAGRRLMPSLNQIGGKAHLALRLAGGETRESVRGEGLFQLRDADIYELPVVLAMLKILRNRRVNRTAFDESNIDFVVQGNDLKINRMEMLGDAISLIGEGDMNLNGQIDVNFYSVVGRNRFYIPILSDLAKASSQQIMWLKVGGTVTEPDIKQELLPGLNESLRQLFAGPEANESSPRQSADPFSNQPANR